MTREEAKKRLEVWLKCMACPEDKQCYDSYLKSTCEYTDYCDETPLDDAIRVAIKALEQEPILDKIRAEIDEQYERVHPYNISCAEGLEMALGIIDKYKVERSDKE